VVLIGKSELGSDYDVVYRYKIKPEPQLPITLSVRRVFSGSGWLVVIVLKIFRVTPIGINFPVKWKGENSAIVRVACPPGPRLY